MHPLRSSVNVFRGSVSLKALTDVSPTKLLFINYFLWHLGSIFPLENPNQPAGLYAVPRVNKVRLSTPFMKEEIDKQKGQPGLLISSL